MEREGILDFALGVFAMAAILGIAACRDSTPLLPETGSAGPFPSTIFVGSVIMTVELDPLGHPPATPSSPAIEVHIRAFVQGFHDLTLQYRLTGFRFYSGGRLSHQFTLPDSLAEERTVRLPANRERFIESTDFYPDLFLGGGVQEGIYLVTVLVEFPSEGTLVEMGLGPALIASNNGLRIGEFDGMRRAVIWGRVTAGAGAPVAGAIMGFDIKWQHCNRSPFLQGGTITVSDGAYRMEIIFEDRVPEVCVTLGASPPPALVEYPIQRRTTGLDFDRPPSGGVIADSVRVDFVLGP